LLKDGVNAIGLDRYSPPHTFGSTQGETRLLRTAYSEGVEFVPMVQRSLQLWKALEGEMSVNLFCQTGMLYCGLPSVQFLKDAVKAARGNPTITLRPIDLGSRPSQLVIPKDWDCLLDADAGFLKCEDAIKAFVTRAGMQAFADVKCEHIVPGSDGIVVKTKHGNIDTGKVIVTTGMWVSELIPELAEVTSSERPFVIVIGDHMLYGFPTDEQNQVKIARHDNGEPVENPDAVDQTIKPSEIEQMSSIVANYFPALGPYLRGSVCVYPKARQDTFIVGALPWDLRIVVGAGLSGHGFKFAPLIGESVATIAQDQEPRVDIDILSVQRALARH
jgi:glycine/D-amino acid oxidase-like deaminating enzyme